MVFTSYQCLRFKIVNTVNSFSKPTDDKKNGEFNISLSMTLHSMEKKVQTLYKLISMEEHTEVDSGAEFMRKQGFL